MGRLIPAGTGLPQYRQMELWVEGFTGDEENPEGEPEVSAGVPLNPVTLNPDETERPVLLVSRTGLFYAPCAYE